MKYCEMVFKDTKFGFANPQIRAKAMSLQTTIAMKMTPEEFYKLLGRNGISSSVPLYTKDVRNEGCKRCL